MIDCKEECRWDERCDAARGFRYKRESCPAFERKVTMTNGDRIRAMSDEELANELGFVAQDAFCYGRGMRPKMMLYPFNSYEEALAWVQEEVKE